MLSGLVSHWSILSGSAAVSFPARRLSMPQPATLLGATAPACAAADPWLPIPARAVRMVRARANGTEAVSPTPIGAAGGTQAHGSTDHRQPDTELPVSG